MTRLLLPIILSVAISSFAADLPRVPSNPIAIGKELLFSNDSIGTESAKVWVKVMPTFAVVDSEQKGWNDLVVETAGDTMWVTINGETTLGAER